MAVTFLACALIRISERLRTRVRERVEAFRHDLAGSMTMVFGLAAPVGMGLVVAAIQFGYIASLHARIQAAADEAALASAKQLTVSYVNSDNVYNTASSLIRAQVGPDAVVSTEISSDRTAVTVRVSEGTKPIMGNLLPLPDSVSATSTAKAVGSAKVCVIGLETAKPDTIAVRQTSALSAAQCSIFSNSTDANGLHVQDSGTVRADVVCAAGSYTAQSASEVVPAPVTGCPQVTDPLASYPQPTFGGCDYNNTNVSQGAVTLLPGVYCGGLHISKSAVATLSQGVYVISGGSLTVDGTSSITGNYVGFFLTNQATFTFAPGTTISLAAPKTGTLAGFLFFEDRSQTQVTDNIQSSGARQLLGTIYLPNSILKVGAQQAVADVSAYTVIVAKQLQIEASSNLVLNVNYGATDVPVPKGVGPIGGKVRLAN